MTRAELLDFVRSHRLAVVATISPAGNPQAAVVGFAATEDLEIVFDTVDATRKVANLRRNPAIALVIGWDEECTVQIEGVADEPAGPELEALKDTYFGRFPDGRVRARWPGITYIRVRPIWLRYSDFRCDPPVIEEMQL